MPRLTRENAPTFIERMRGIPEDRTPEWGRMNRNQMYGHVGVVLEYCLGKMASFPNHTTLYRRIVMKHLLFSGLVEFPKSVPLPKLEDGTRPPFPEASLGDFETKLEAYFAAQESGNMNPPPHPYFGDIGIKGWGTFHYRHINHHLKQFGA